MARTRSEKKANGEQAALANGHRVLDGKINKDKKTDYSRWRLLDENGRQTWHYLKSDEEVKKWPQSDADKYHLGLETVSSGN
jgi:lanosterol synthase